MHIKHIAINVEDIEKSIEFYETMTEISVVRRFKAGDGEVVFLSNGEGETEIELIHLPDKEKYSGQGLFICFETDKLDQMHKIATDKGLSPSPIQEPDDGTRYFYVYDPNGVSVQLRVFS